MIDRLASRTDSGRPDGREDGAVEGSTTLADPLAASTALVPFVSPNEPHAPRTRSGSRRKRTDGKDDSVPGSSSRQLVLTPNHSRQEYLEYLMTQGSENSEGLPTNNRKQSKLLPASPCPLQVESGANQSLSASRDTLPEASGGDQGGVEASQRAAIEQAGPVHASDAAVSRGEAGNHLLIPQGTDTVGEGRLAAAARQTATVDEPTYVATDTEEDPAPTGRALVPSVPLPAATPSRTKQQGATAGQPTALIRAADSEMHTRASTTVTAAEKSHGIP